MPKKDIYHDIVRIAIEKDGWTITDDPLTIPTPGIDFHIDLGASKNLISAIKGEKRIAIEIKSLSGNSAFYDYHQALGQFLMYKLALEIAYKSHLLYLAIPESQFMRLNEINIYKLSWKKYGVNLLVFNEFSKEAIQWINS